MRKHPKQAILHFQGKGVSTNRPYGWSDDYPPALVTEPVWKRLCEYKKLLGPHAPKDWYAQSLTGSGERYIPVKATHLPETNHIQLMFPIIPNQHSQTLSIVLPAHQLPSLVRFMEENS